MKKIWISLFLFIPLLAIAKPQTTDPILRINGSMHASRVNRLDVDPQGRFIVTASEDKTARLWDAKSGSLIRVFRLPIDYGNEGKLDAAAITPDGRYVAVGGWTGYDWYEKCSIYIFNAATGEIEKQIPVSWSTIKDIEISPDGKYLVACLGGDAGVRVYKTSDWSLYATIEDPQGDTYNSSISKDGRFAIVSFDGFLRVYKFSDTSRPAVQTRTPGGSKPFSVAFSPDGKKIAVGYDDANLIQVFDSRTLDWLYDPNLTESGNNNRIDKVTWSRDSRYLYGTGGFYKKVDGKWWRFVRRWDSQGQGSYTDFQAGLNNIMDLKALPEDSLVVGGSNPDFGRLDRNGAFAFYQKNDSYTFYNYQYKYLRVSPDGTEVSYMPDYTDTITFSIMNRDLRFEKSSYPVSTTYGNGAEFTGWEDSYYPKLNGRRLPLENYEMSRSVDVSPDGQYIVMGTSWSIYRFDQDGKKLWKVPVPGVAWAVNIVENKNIVVAALGDGTIRWYRLKDGAELLALYSTSTRKWVAWTPKGYYDCSPGGDNYIGWHVNNGTNRAADFYPASRFSSQYYRPDILPLALSLEDEDAAIAQANTSKRITPVAGGVMNALPPVVRILSPQESSTLESSNITITFTVKSPQGTDIKEIKTLVNGRPVQNNLKGLVVQAVQTEADSQTLTLNLPAGQSEVSILARNNNGWSEPASIQLTYQPRVAPARQGEFVILPRLYVLAIGVSDYSNSSYRLKYSAKDAQDFAALMQRQKGTLYRDVVVKVLTDAEATKDNILDGLDWIQHETTSKDVAMVFLSGHGINDENSFFYYLPVGADVAKMKRTCVPFTDIKNTVSSIAGKAIFFVDTCHSGNVMGGRRGVSDVTAIVNELSSAENGAIVFTSSTGNQYSLEDDAWGNGAFTKALIEGLSGKADYSGNGKITINMLDLYISERVKELTRGSQTPATTKPQTIADFPVIIR